MKLHLLLSMCISTPLLAMESNEPVAIQAHETDTQEYIIWLDRRLAEQGSLEGILFFAEDLTKIEEYAQTPIDLSLAKRLQNIVSALQQLPSLQHYENRLNKLMILLHTKRHVEGQSKEVKTFKRKKAPAPQSSPSIPTEAFAAGSDLGMSKVYSQTLDESASKAASVRETLRNRSLEVVKNEVKAQALQIQIDMLGKFICDNPSLLPQIRDSLLADCKRLVTQRGEYLEQVMQQKIALAQLEKEAESLHITTEEAKAGLVGRIDATTIQIQEIQSSIEAFESDSNLKRTQINVHQAQIDLLTSQLASNNENLEKLIAKLPELQAKQREHRSYKKQLATINLKTAVAEGKLLPKAEPSAQYAILQSETEE